MRRGVLKPKSAPNKFAKSEEHSRWAVRKRIELKLKSFIKTKEDKEC